MCSQQSQVQNEELLQCFNRGCGQKFLAENNTEDACRHHPGTPVFHDAYKGWSCCNKKSTDFTEFLNIVGCTLSKHSDKKPVESEPVKRVIEEPPVRPNRIENRVVQGQDRPKFDAPLTVIKPHVAVPVISQEKVVKQVVNDDSQEVPIGTVCKHGGCNVTFQKDSDSRLSTCLYHPGVPVFHEGLKFWSCCQKRTTDFNAFLSQVGCEQGQHVWKNENKDDESSVKCRWDYHQTGSFVVVSVYAKGYCTESSVIKVSPVRFHIKLVFPEKNHACFSIDAELFDVVDVKETEATMYGTKVEVKLKKAVPHYWTRFELKQGSQ